MKDRVSAKEKRSWELYQTVFGPFGAAREDYNAAMIASVIYRLGDVMKALKGVTPGEPVKLKDCLLDFKPAVNVEMPIEEIIENGKNELEALVGKWRK